jgi:hypothetical protein
VVVSRRALALAFTDFLVADGNFYGSRDGSAIDTIILHTTVGDLASAISRFEQAGTEVSAHWIVGWDGSLHRGVEERFTAYHAGEWDENLRSIGIEHVDNRDYDGIRPDALYTTSGTLVAEICARHPITRILAHRDVHPTRCCDALDTARIITLANGGDMALTDADKAWIDQRIRDVVMAEDIATFAVRNALSRELGNRGLAKGGIIREPDTHMRGDPPKGHPAAKPEGKK